MQLKGRIHFVKGSEITGLNSVNKINHMQASFRKLILEKVSILLRYQNICTDKINEFNDRSRDLAAIETYKNINILQKKREIINKFIGSGNRHNFDNMLYHNRLTHIKNCDRCRNKLSQLNKTYKVTVDNDEIYNLSPHIDDKIMKNINNIVTGKLNSSDDISLETINTINEYMPKYKLIKNLQLKVEILYNQLFKDINRIFESIKYNIIPIYKLTVNDINSYIEVSISGKTAKISVQELMEKYKQ